MVPASPPLPSPWNLEFQADAGGSQTSNWIAGLTVPATRQKAGSCNAVVEPGGVKGPAACDSARVIVVSGSERSFRDSHVAATAAGEASASTAKKTKQQA